MHELNISNSLLQFSFYFRLFEAVKIPLMSRFFWKVNLWIWMFLCVRLVVVFVLEFQFMCGGSCWLIKSVTVLNLFSWFKERTFWLSYDNMMIIYQVSITFLYTNLTWSKYLTWHSSFFYASDNKTCMF